MQVDARNRLFIRAMCATRHARLKYNYHSDSGGYNKSNNNNNNDDDDTEQSCGAVSASALGIELFSGASKRAVGGAGSRRVIAPH
jgi:hypothetical protein